jgi:hypothetical protein
VGYQQHRPAQQPSGLSLLLLGLAALRPVGYPCLPTGRRSIPQPIGMNCFIRIPAYLSLKSGSMEQVYLVKVKKEYAAAAIEQLLQENALEAIEHRGAASPDERMNLIREEREKYIRGEDAFFTWEQVKALAQRKSLH